MVGDRILSDVVMANRLGMYSIRVLPFDTARENIVVKTVRIFEDHVAGYLVPGLCRQQARRLLF